MELETESRRIIGTFDSQKHSFRYTRERFTLTLASIFSVIVLAFNLGFVIWAVVLHRLEGGRGTLHEGSCEKVLHMGTGLCLAINILSTSLLVSSNYCMVGQTLLHYSHTARFTECSLRQCLCAPTTNAIDRAHQKDKWLNIDIPSIRNQREVLKKRAFFVVVPSSLISSTPSDVMLSPVSLLIESDILVTNDTNSAFPCQLVQSQASFMPMDNIFYGIYCPVEQPLQRCKLECSLPLAITVVLSILCKAITIGYSAISATEKSILTTGDAVASFIQRPDESTRGQCLLTKEAVEKLHYRLEYKPSYTIAIAACISLLIYSLTTIFDKSRVWTMGFSAINSQTLIRLRWDHNPNREHPLRQLIFSLIYFTFNPIFTATALASEWSRYANRRKGLRVSGHPESAQRSSYFVSLPYRFALPSMAFSAIPHWLISQSIFLVGIESYTDTLQRDPKRDVITCGYSLSAIVGSIAVGVVMVAWLVGFGFKRLESGMLVPGSCSLAIAAACHPALRIDGGEFVDGEGMSAAEQMPVQWGVTFVDVDGQGRSSFSSEEATGPENRKVCR
ncbi:hypothetical protein BDV23DRAFT_195384 [Aspergillus alliaceus]|uniref:DUF6536 domain-containing protein n=1 Tax=Petromyces alliaceus TaxID=209559 RepID=A0A5N7CLT3_PETAA|nr:hypothetical protein BDV23DRAFT_195384 [Aspergillus alliaceus]